MTSITNNNLQYISTAEPTYWPTDPQRIPDLLDFFVTKGIAQNYIDVDGSLDLSSDHSPLFATLRSTVVYKKQPLRLFNKATDWNAFRATVNEDLSLKIPLKTPVQNRTCNHPLQIKRKIAEKRTLRRIWQQSRNPRDKTNLNRATQNLKRNLRHLKNEWFSNYTANLSPNESTDYSLWKATRGMKRTNIPIPPISKSDGTWARSHVEKSEVFVNHLAAVFTPNPSLVNHDEIQECIDSPNQLSPPIKPFTPSKVSKIIKRLKLCKARGYDLITGKVLKELPRKAILYLTLIFNSILRIEYFPAQWKFSEIIMIAKPGKPHNQASCYRPISLLPIISKLF